MEYVDKINMDFGGEGTNYTLLPVQALRKFVYKIS